MRSVFIVVTSPFLDALAGVGQRQELIGPHKVVQQQS